MNTTAKGVKKGRLKLRGNKHPVAFTALLYLKEALLKERYEECDEIITRAKEFGANFNEILWLLEDPRRLPLP